MSINRSIVIKIIISSLIVLLMITAYFGSIDQVGRSYTETGLKRALLTFGIARGLNGVISVAQGTEVAMQPAGIGINFAPGQILDPVNDLIEHFSYIMLACSASLGTQRVLLDMLSWPGFTLLISVVLLAVLYLLWNKRALSLPVRRFIYKTAAILLLIRFAIPGVAIANEGIYQLFIKSEYESSKQKLAETTDNISTIHRDTQRDILPEDNQSLIDDARRFYQSVSRQMDIEARVEQYKTSAENLIEYTINLIVVFVLQTIIFPLVFFWLIIKAIKHISHS